MLFQRICHSAPVQNCVSCPTNEAQTAPCNVIQTSFASDLPSDDMAADLAALIGDAITTWSKKYHLENLPKDILLDQVLSIITAIRKSL